MSTLLKHPERLSVSLWLILFLTRGPSGSNVLSQPYFPKARQAGGVAPGGAGEGEREAALTHFSSAIKEACVKICPFSFLFSGEEKNTQTWKLVEILICSSMTLKVQPENKN